MHNRNIHNLLRREAARQHSMYHRHARHRDSRRRECKISRRDLLVGAGREAIHEDRALCGYANLGLIGMDSTAEIEVLKADVFVWRDRDERWCPVGALLLARGENCVG